MTDPNYAKTIAVPSSASDVFQALTSGIENWWTKPDQPFTEVGDRAKFIFPPGKSYWTFEVSRLTPNSYVELTCIDALHLHDGLPNSIEKEWLGTQLKFRIEATTGGTAIHFEHVGLQPKLLCYDVCEAGWNFFFLDSLKAFLETGIGKAHQANSKA